MRRCGWTVAVLVLALLAPARASAALPTSVALFGDDNAGPADGFAYLATPADHAISATFDGSTLTVKTYAKGLTNADTLAAPPGQTLTPGVYDGATDLAHRIPGRPAMDLGRNDGWWEDCAFGRFEVKDLAAAPDGTLTRLWAIVQSRCLESPVGEVGELRIGEPAEPGAAATAPGILRFDDSDVGTVSAAMPVTLMASGPMQVASVRVDGGDAASFPIAHDDCTGRSLAAGEQCQVWVDFAPARPGTLAATLQIAGADGGTHGTELEGFARAGVTDLHLQSSPGDWVGSGGTYSHHPHEPGFGFAVVGTPREVEFDVSSRDSDYWEGYLRAGDGPDLTVGSQEQDTPAPAGGRGLEVIGNSHGCDRTTWSYTIHDLAFDADQYLVRLDADFEQSCDGGPPLTGRVRLHAGDATPPAPWMAGGDPAEEPAPPVGTAGSGASLAPAAALASAPAAAGSGPASRAAAPRTALALLRRQSRRTVARRGLLVTGVAARPLRVRLTVGRGVARALRLGSRTVGRASVRRAGRFSLRVRLPARVARSAGRITVHAGARSAVVRLR